MKKTLQQTPRAPFLPTLEGLRALAALGIIVTHVAFQTGHDHGQWWERLLGRFDYFVPVFFALSGFLLWRRHRADTAWRSYYVKRIGRIIPAYWVCLLVVIVVLPVGHLWGSPDVHSGVFTYNQDAIVTRIWDVVAMVFLVQNYGGNVTMGGLSHLWSLCVEMGFYLILPLLAMCLRRVRPWLRIVAIAGVGVLSLGFSALPFFEANPTGHQINPQVLPPAFALWFGIGMITAELEVYKLTTTRPQWWQRAEKLFRFRPLWWAVAAAALWVAAQPWWGPSGLTHPTSAEFARRLVTGGVFAAAIVVPYALGPGGVFERPLMQALGRWSYSIFLWHVAVLSTVFTLLGVDLFSGHFILVFVATVALTIPVAAISYALVEEPARRAVSAWAKRNNM